MPQSGAVQCLRSLRAAEVIAVDPDAEALKLAASCGAHHTPAANTAGAEVGRITGGAGAEVVIDFVGEGDAPGNSLAIVRGAGTYFVVGYVGPQSREQLIRVRRVRAAAGDERETRRRVLGEDHPDTLVELLGTGAADPEFNTTLDEGK